MGWAGLGWIGAGFELVCKVVWVVSVSVSVSGVGAKKFSPLPTPYKQRKKERIYRNQGFVYIYN